jgi:hypothetical protein
MSLQNFMKGFCLHFGFDNIDDVLHQLASDTPAFKFIIREFYKNINSKFNDDKLVQHRYDQMLYLKTSETGFRSMRANAAVAKKKAKRQNTEAAVAKKETKRPTAEAAVAKKETKRPTAEAAVAKKETKRPTAEAAVSCKISWADSAGEELYDDSDEAAVAKKETKRPTAEAAVSRKISWADSAGEELYDDDSNEESSKNDNDESWACKTSHVQVSHMSQPASPKPTFSVEKKKSDENRTKVFQCRNFAKNGKCPYGNKCHFLHDSSAVHDKTQSQSPVKLCVDFFINEDNHEEGEGDCKYSHDAEVFQKRAMTECVHNGKSYCKWHAQDICFFRHDDAAPEVQKKPCFKFKNTGYCRFEDGCRYSHSN